MTRFRGRRRCVFSLLFVEWTVELIAMIHSTISIEEVFSDFLIRSCSFLSPSYRRRKLTMTLQQRPLLPTSYSTSNNQESLFCRSVCSPWNWVRLSLCPPVHTAILTRRRRQSTDLSRRLPTDLRPNSLRLQNALTLANRLRQRDLPRRPEDEIPRSPSPTLDRRASSTVHYSFRIRDDVLYLCYCCSGGRSVCGGGES